jgi:hypothetical protein
MRRIYILAIVFFLLVTVLVNYVTDRRNSGATEETPQNQETIAPEGNTASSYINIDLLGTASRFPKNQNVVLQIRANSDGKIIYGYDVLVDYDTMAFDLISATSRFPDFTLYKFPKDNYLALTVIQSVTSSKTYIFQDQTVAQLVFKPKKAGSFTFSINPAHGKEKTKLVDNKAQIIYPKTNNLTVEIY